MNEQQTEAADRFNRGWRWLSVIAVVIGAVVLISTSLGLIEKTRVTGVTRDIALIGAEQIHRQDAIFKEIESRIDSLKSRLQTIEQNIASSSNIPPETAMLIEVKKLSNQISDIEIKETKLESVILEYPVKALEMPLLKRDLDSLKDAQQAA